MNFFLIKLRRDIKFILNFFLQLKLSPLRKPQSQKYGIFKKAFRENLAAVKVYETDRFLTKAWKQFVLNMEKRMLPYPKFNFLSDPVILYTMFATAGGAWIRKQLEFIESRLKKDEIIRLLSEDAFGEPLLLSSKYATSHSSVQHLYSIERYLYKTGRDIKEIESVIEWGGGYGNMAKMFYRKKQAPFKYVIIDIPVFSVIQWLYLCVTVGEERVNLVKTHDCEIQDGKINLVPLCFVEDIKGGFDMFVSTWALSESSKEAQDFVAAKKLFGAKKILFANQSSDASFPYAENLGSMAASNNAISEEIAFLKGHYYHFL